MPETENPRSYIRPIPLPVPAHKGLKITARNATVYTCEFPTRKEVAKENYERRKHQITRCGYRSVNYKPYQSVGEVYLDERMLILNSLGQRGSGSGDVTNQQDNSSTSSSDSESDDDVFSKAPTKQADHQRVTAPKPSAYKPKVINDIKSQVNKGRKLVNAVRLGFGLFRMIRDEQEMKNALAEQERKQREEDARTKMKPPSTDSEGSDDELEDELRSYIIPVSAPVPTLEVGEGGVDVEKASSIASSTSSQRWQKLNSAVRLVSPALRVPSPAADKQSAAEVTRDRSSTECHMTERALLSPPPGPSQHRTHYLTPPKSAVSSNSANGSRNAKKPIRPRPFSPVYSNINSNDVENRHSVFRQLCALNWLLEAMSQDQQPPTMPPITNCWILKDLKEDPRFVRRKVEKDKTTEKEWKDFMQNPARFTQRGTRRGTRKISINPNFIHKLSTSNSTSSSPGPSATPGLRIPTDYARCSSVTSFTAETVGSSQPEQTPDLETPEERSNYEETTTSGSPVLHVAFANQPVIRSTSAPPHQVKPGRSNSIPSPSGTVGERRPSGKLRKQRSFTVTTVYQSPVKMNKAMHKLRAKSRAAKILQNSLSQKELEKLAPTEDEQQDSRVRAWVQATGAVNNKRFAAAAIAAFGAISMDNRVEKVPNEMKSKFNEVSEEKALVLHDNLEVRDRTRLQILERKLMALETFNDMYRALDHMRVNSVLPDKETHEEMRQRVSEECQWYKDLNHNLPREIREDRYCTLVLNKIAQYGSLEGRKASSNQFLKVLSVLRIWEICAPDISAAIEFIREKVVKMTEQDYEEWLNRRFPVPTRAASAPPPRTSGRL